MARRRTIEPQIATVSAVDSIIADFEYRLTVARAVRELILSGVSVPDIAPMLSDIAPRSAGAREWAPRLGSNAERIVLLLERAVPEGLSEDDIVAALRRQGRLAMLKNPIASVHWTLSNLQRRSGALRRDHQGRWHIIARLPKRPQNKEGDQG